MTVKELMQATGKSRDAVLKAIHEILPDKTILPRQKIVLEKDEIDKVLEILQQDYRILKEPAEKTSKMLYLSVKREVNASTLRELAKYMTPEEIRNYILQSTNITSFRQLEEPEKHKKDEEAEGK